jgi:AraC family transcriptional regulator
VWEGASLWVLHAPPGQSYPRTDFHSHHVIQVSLALSGEVHFDGDAGHVSGVAVAVAPDAPHAFRGTGLVAHLFIAPDGQAGRELVRGLFAGGPIAHVPVRMLGELPSRLERQFVRAGRTDDELRALGRELVARLAGVRVRSEPVDRRVTKLVAWLGARLDRAVSLGDAASVVGLSEGRTRHLFVEHTGLSFRTYVLWLRLVRAVEMFAVGASLTEAAHGAGFADSAHLSRTFRRMFGIAAASLRVGE